MIDSLQMVADSLRQVYVADSLRGVFVADSISAARLALAQRVFGEGSVVCEATHPYIYMDGAASQSVAPLVESPIYIVLAVAFSLLYLIWLPHIIKDGGVKWSRLAKSLNREAGDNRAVVGQQRLGIEIATWSLSVVFIALLTVRAVVQFSPLEFDFEGWGWVVGIVVSTLIVGLYGWGVIKVGGYLTNQVDFAKRVLLMKRQILFFGDVFISPLLVMSLLATYIQGEWIVNLSLFVMIIFILLFIRQSFLLFMQQNISILHWFLYLCGVEIFPLTFVWAIASRYMIV